MTEYKDPAFNPDRQIFHSRLLGALASGSDAFAAELSKLSNGLLLSTSETLGADSASKYFANNVKVMSDFQKGIEQAKPEAAKYGKYAAIGTGALLTTPAIAGLKSSIAAGYAGALSSGLADVGSNEAPPTSSDVKHAVLTSVPLGILGGVTGSALLHGGHVLEHMAKGTLNKFLQASTPVQSRSIEAGIEGVDPNLYISNHKENK